MLFLGENVLRQNKNGNIVTKKGEPVLRDGIIDEQIFNQIFPGFDQEETPRPTRPTRPTPATRPTRPTPATKPTQSSSEPDMKTNSGNYAGPSYFITTVLFLVQMI